MQVFVSEYLCGGAAIGLAPSLRREGWAMLAALLEDLAAIPGVEPITLLGRDADSLPEDISVVRCADPEAERTLFGQLASAADWTVVIAPEFAGLLMDRCRQVEVAGGRLLGSTPTALAISSDKRILAAVLADKGVSTPPCLAVTPNLVAPAEFLPGVLKPADGAGSQATCLVPTAADLPLCLARIRQVWVGPLILQPYVPGLAASVSLLLGPGLAFPMPAGRQRLSADGFFHYLGGEIPLPGVLDVRARALALRAVAAVPGLAGYVGVDLVLGDGADGSGDAIIEINPRLTTSYLGLRRLARFNLAAAMLAVVEGRAPPMWDWQPGPVRFDVEGIGDFPHPV
jgi:tyramine---L-glutamate ligase